MSLEISPLGHKRGGIKVLNIKGSFFFPFPFPFQLQGQIASRRGLDRDHAIYIPYTIQTHRSSHRDCTIEPPKNLRPARCLHFRSTAWLGKEEEKEKKKRKKLPTDSVVVVVVVEVTLALRGGESRPLFRIEGPELVRIRAWGFEKKN